MAAAGKGRQQRAILAALSHGDWVRSDELAQTIGIKRDVLWPYLERLRFHGHRIEGDRPGTASRGYRLVQ